MKTLLILFLAVLSAVSVSATHRYPRPHRRVSTPSKTEIAVPWETVAAGGAAAGTIIAAYKVSDGVEDGIRTVAKEKPEVFADTLSVLTWPIRWAVLILFLLVYCWIWKIFIHKTTNSTKGFRKWKIH